MINDPRRRPDEATNGGNTVDRDNGASERRPAPDVSRRQGGERRVGPEDEERHILPGERRPTRTDG